MSAPTYHAKTLQTNVKVHNFNAKVRKFSSAREAALSENFVPESVYDSLVAAVNKHLPLCNAMYNCVQKFWNFRLEDVRYAYAIIRYRLQVYLWRIIGQSSSLGYWWDYLSRVKRVSNGGLMCMSTKENACGAYSGGSMIPMPSCCWTGKIHW